MDELKYFKICRVKCDCCGDVLEYVNETKESNSPTVLYCSCKKVGLDPSATMYRILGNEEDYTDLSVEWGDERLIGDDETTKRRFFHALDNALYSLESSATCFSYKDDPLYLNVVHCIRNTMKELTPVPYTDEELEEALLSRRNCKNHGGY